MELENIELKDTKNPVGDFGELLRKINKENNGKSGEDIVKDFVDNLLNNELGTLLKRYATMYIGIRMNIESPTFIMIDLFKPKEFTHSKYMKLLTEAFLARGINFCYKSSWLSSGYIKFSWTVNK